MGPGTLGDQEGLWTARLPLAVALMQDSPDLGTDDVNRSQAQECHHAAQLPAGGCNRSLKR